MNRISNIIPYNGNIFKISQILVFLPNNDHSHANLMEVQNIYSPARGNKSSIKRYDFSTRRANIELCFLNEDISTVDLNIMVKCVVNQTLQCHTYQDRLNDLTSENGNLYVLKGLRSNLEPS